MTEKKKKTILPYTVLLMIFSYGLSYLEIFKWPFGTFITLASFAPLLVIVYKYGVKWGLFIGMFYGLLKGCSDLFLFGGAHGLSPTHLAIILIIDYIVAFGLLGFAGLFRDSINSDILGNLLGGAFAMILNWGAHFVARFLVYGQQAKEMLLEMKNSFVGTKFAGTTLESTIATICDGVITHHSGNYRGELYAFVYTATYMAPELVITLVVVLLLMITPKIKDFVSYD